MLYYSNSTQIMFAGISHCLNISYRLKFFENMPTEEMQKEDTSVVEYSNIKSETNQKSKLQKAI